MTNIAIGIDSGGSKTVAIAGDLKGNIVGRGTAGAANPLSVGIDRSLENIITSIKNSTHLINKPIIKSLYVSTAGGRPKIIKVLRQTIKLSPLLHIKGPIVVDHDLRAALYSGLPKGDGIVLIAGTGSAAFGIDKHGKEVIVSGWNHWLGETGGYELGMKAIIAATRSYDGRGEKTILESIVAKHFGIKNLFTELPEIIKAPFVDSPKIAALAPSVAQAAYDGDQAARRIIEEMVEELDCCLKAAVNRTGEKRPLKVVLVGSMFRMKVDIISKLKEKVSRWNSNVQFIFPKEEPAITAYKFALKNLKASGKTIFNG